MPIVSVHDLHKSFGTLEVLRGVSFDVEPGETVILAGPSGSGKSTMLRCLNGLEKIQAGEVIVDGTSVHAPDTDLLDLRRRVGMVFQSFNLFPHLTIMENITMPLTKVLGKDLDEAREIGRSLLDKVGIVDKVDVYPDNLSGGQQQRAAIARGLAMNPHVMLFDEPTSALDPELTGGILDVMGELSQSGMTMLVVTHEMGFARKAADRMIFMDGGVIVEEGSPSQLIDNPQNERTRQFMRQITHD
ncbi:amino acid ABC transporter ATP-binding protein [Desulfoplanes formicivorans]|jgi:ABC-type polar amino acid transport system ATPase subunit|uniref:Peptide ABC transporter ATP-binding protein n=1 Tax=Desulfoplanes formicivorans TaxID=1592317 RepID=A0A194AJJ1_9BACT|nr:amino acid ABC transporter ATP-binding protein [Desulfoplanes formicivorans]GAU09488.1 peptide ABC transporter ATP-binding protein [Desulfoplanes formicivorans]